MGAPVLESINRPETVTAVKHEHGIDPTPTSVDEYRRTAYGLRLHLIANGRVPTDDQRETARQLAERDVRDWLDGGAWLRQHPEEVA